MIAKRIAGARRSLVAAVLAGALATAGGCASLLGIGGDFTVQGSGGSTTSSSSSAGTAGGGNGGSSSNGGAPSTGGAGGGGGGSGPVCGVAPPNTVVGCGHVTHFLYDNTTAVDDTDFSQLTVQALIYDASAKTFQTVPGTGKSDGTFVIPNVPDGKSFYLELGDPNAQITSYYFTDQHSLDLNFSQSGRPSTPVQSDTEVTLHLTGMTPWHAIDNVIINGINVGDQTYVTTPPASGASVVDQTFDWRTAVSEQTWGFMLGEGARPAGVMDAPGDDLTVEHNVVVPIADSTGQTFLFTSVGDSFRKLDVGMVDGTPLPVSGAFSVPPPAPFVISWSADLTAGRAAFGSSGRYTEENFECSRWASPGDDGLWGGDSVADIIGDTTPNISTLTLPAQSFRTPSPAGWQQFMGCTLLHYKAWRAPGMSGYRVSTDYLRAEATATNTYKFVAPVSAPTNIKVDGLAALDGGSAPFDGSKALILSWDPVTTASRYLVIVIQYLPSSGDIVFQGTFHTTDTTLAIPPGLLDVGGFYYFRVGAIRGGDYKSGRLLEIGFPWSLARTSTNIVRLSTLCGNGHVDPGEDCDTSGPSATCNADCTFSTCGDTHPNALAGEECDNGTDDSPTCDGATCKHPVCGDGYQNPWVEECDDGNTVDGDGCSHDCKLEHCGDGVLDDFEGCDDGNNVAGDGCSPRCQLEPGFTCDTSTTPTTCTWM